jgi:glycosyltransferase involved in cell wall biosynthesis
MVSSRSTHRPSGEMRLVVAIVGPAPGRWGGIAEVARTLREEWTALGHEVICVDPSERGRANPIMLFRLGQRLRRLARDNDLRVHLNVSTGASTWRKVVLARMLESRSIPYLVHLHSGAYREFVARQGPWRRRMVRRLFASAHAVAVVSEAQATLVRDALGIADPVVVPNGVADTGFGPEGRAKSERTHLVFIGRVGHEKGTPLVVEALAELARSGQQDWQLDVFGDGHIEELRSRAAESGIGQNVTVHGWSDRQTTIGALRRAHIFVLPSRAEGLPMALLEAMSAGSCVVASSVGGIPDVIEDGHDGLLVPPDDLHALMATLSRLLDDREEIKALGYAARRTWAARFSGRRMAERLIDLHLPITPRPADSRDSGP